ncbi:hypothetical protein [Haloterrigena alkaliphila]|uniref:Uncharacterized protein n=1 Tax=Haloterrigena alkaliphila TaxID=2816475 RepID=A0A8A2VIW6_9EURY|nr:hypothetical protein [Haloterrigena alkaliphila]QSX00578.1 hypothetical protein J0X25_06360 [Haloterrigena alkaliphila]
MGADDTSSETFVASLHRTILGALLAAAGLVGIGGVREAISDGSVLYGVLGVALAGVAAYWIFDLFVDGLRER